jgi:hypothetical protein
MGQPFGLLRILASVGGSTNLAASLDGVPSQFVRVQSPPGGFEVNLAAHDVFGFNVGPVTLHGVADGFWVLLPSPYRTAFAYLRRVSSILLLSGNVDELRLVQGVQVLSPLSEEVLTIPLTAMFH